MLAAALSSAALLAAGCGGDDGPARLSKAQYIGRADDICRASQKRLEPIERQLQAIPRDAQGRGLTGQIAPILERALDATRDGYERLRALPVPAEDRAVAERWLASTAIAIAAFEDVVDAVRDDDREAARKPGERVDMLSEEQRRLARRYGFKACRSAASTDE